VRTLIGGGDVRRGVIGSKRADESNEPVAVITIRWSITMFTWKRSPSLGEKPWVRGTCN